MNAVGGGTAMAFARAFWLRPAGSRNSCFKMSPAWGLWTVVMGVSIVVVCKGNIAMLGRAQQGVSGRWGAVGEKQKPPSEVLGGLTRRSVKG